MNAHAVLWIEALRSGEYRQTSHHLRQHGKSFWRKPAYCAMGVLYDLYLTAHNEEWPSTPLPGGLPSAALEWVGIDRHVECDVVGYNDVGMNFRDIASILEAWFHRTERERCWQEAGRIAGQWVEEAQHANHKTR